MFFWTRALLCIGAVTVMAIQRQPKDPRPASPASASMPDATILVGKACRARPDLCAAAVTRGFEALSHEAPPGRPRTPHRGLGHELPVALGARSLT